MRFTLCKLFLGVTMAALASAGMTLHTPLVGGGDRQLFNCALHRRGHHWHFAAVARPGHSASPSPRSVEVTCCWYCATRSRRSAICW